MVYQMPESWITWQFLRARLAFFAYDRLKDQVDDKKVRRIEFELSVTDMVEVLEGITIGIGSVKQIARKRQKSK
jgi:hypothetical protein